jgi:cytochrome c556
MRLRNLTTSVLAATVVLGLGVSLAYASADDQIKARQAEMKANGAAMKALSAIVKGEAPYSADAVKKEIDGMIAAEKATDPKAWAADSQKGETVETYAKPEVWSQPDDFGAKYKALLDARTALAATTDEAGFKAAFPALGAACKGCHETYRRPKE